MQIHGYQKTVRSLIEPHLYLIGIIFMVQHQHSLADQRHRRLIKPTVQCDGAVLAHRTIECFSEVVFQVFRRLADTGKVAGEAGKWRHVRGAVHALVVNAVKPLGKAVVETIEAAGIGIG